MPSRWCGRDTPFAYLETMNPAQFWLTLALAVISSSVVAAGVSGFVSMRLAERAKDTEHEQWLRNEKLRRYADYLEALNIEPDSLSRSSGEGSARAAIERGNRVMLSYAQMQLVAPQQVLNSAQSFKAKYDQAESVISAAKRPSDFTPEAPPSVALRELLVSRVAMAETMRKDLKVKD